jgi:hypothetical protein
VEVSDNLFPDGWEFLEKQLWARVDESGDIWLAVDPDDGPSRQWMISAGDVDALVAFLGRYLGGSDG